MIKLPKKIIFSSLAIILVAGALWFFLGSLPAQALDTGLNYATETGLGARDPKAIVANIIRVILGFLGVVGVGLIIYAGFVWMTAKGEEEKIEKAKKIMISATIGLVIVMASFALATFILNRLLDATGGAGSGSGGGSGGGGIGGNQIFSVVGTTPAHQSVNVIRNAVVRFRLSDSVRQTSVTNNSFIVMSGGQVIDGTRTVSGNYIEFAPSANCEAPNETIKCFPKNATIAVEAKNGATGIISVGDKELTCGGSSNCLIQFMTGEIIDTAAPRINITSQQICADANNTLAASSTDDYGVSKIDFYVNNDFIDSAINNSNPFVGSPFNAEVFWDGTGFEAGQDITLKATAYDLDSNDASAEKTIRLSPSHCCNGIKDEDEEGIDCGGSCLACSGQACATDENIPSQCFDNLCQSGICQTTGSNQQICEAAGYPKGTTSCCLCQDRPLISWVSPAGGFCSNDVNKFCRKATEVQDCGANASCDLGTPNGATGNFITIAGSGFGTNRGKVFFSTFTSSLVEAKLADDPIAGNPACNNSVWRNDQIIAVVPAGAEQGSITIETATGSKDATNDAYGALINDFRKNNIERPGVCAISPAAGKINDVVAYNGVKLSSAEAYYGNLGNNVKALVSAFNNSLQGTATVPNIVSGSTTTFVIKANVESNFLPFTKENEPYDGPIISSIEPSTGPVGQYVTIRGSGFGNTKSTSKLFFGSSTSGYEADYNFPDVCADSVWTDKQIVVKVPTNIPLAQYQIYLQRTGYPEVNSGTQSFSATAGLPDPGVCRLQPSLGQSNSEVMLWGEYFGDKGNNSAVRFYNNLNQQGQALTFWGIDEAASGIKPWKVITTVPQSATTGPVRVVRDDNKLSNVLNFIVGQCKQNSDCGSEPGATCCAAGLPEAGKCKASPDECYGLIATSVYEWHFSTGTNLGQCAPGQNQCGTVCCAGDCDPVPNKCAKCLVNQNECGDGTCCNQPCIGSPSYCPDPESCSGYNYNQCSEGFYCPNSPGFCSPYPGSGNPIVVGDCSQATCESKPGCGTGNCYYEASLNVCVKSNTESCSKINLKDNNDEIIKQNNQPVRGSCDVYNNNSRWHISNWTQSCPAGWTKLANNRCVDANSINGVCSKCSNPFVCKYASGVLNEEGKCVIDEAICPVGSVCDSGDQKCKKTDTGKCDCCCRKDNQNEDCCEGLICDGTCGSGGSNLGFCSGCVINGVPNDDVCNCFGHNGKFCDATSDPRGICVDCSAITNLEECSRHSACCVDGKNNNRCSGIVEGGSSFENNGLMYCSYFNCTNTYPNSCNENPFITGVYNKITTCQQGCTSAPIYCSLNQATCENPKCPEEMYCNLSSCECLSRDPNVGEPCIDPITQSCTGQCNTGYQCLLPDGYGGGAGDCLCCCKPPSNPNEPDSCQQINSNLSCLPNKTPCTSQTNQRGLCCGCSKDSECGKDVSRTGCSAIDRCCRNRPAVTAYLPAINEENVCRNTVVEATFNQIIDPSTLGITDQTSIPNVTLIADYGLSSCSSDGYYPVAEAYQPNSRLASIIFSLKKLAVRIFPSLITKPAFAAVKNYCYIPGTALAYNINASQTRVTYRLTKALKAYVDYYVVLKGDADLVNNIEKDFYNANITSLEKIGMVGYAQGGASDAFNNTTFKNAEIWKFTTGSDICALEKVKVEPNFYLFQRPAQEGSLVATALDRNNNEIQPLNNFYSWDWSWLIDDSEIAEIRPGSEPQKFTATVVSKNKQDAQTLVRAKSTIVVDKFNQPSTVGRSREGISTIRVFLCENPWPVYKPNYAWPWQDQTTGIEFYYCRDKNNSGTFDDLPALTNPPIANQGGRKICMFGQNSGKTCTSDANCNNLIGSCLPEVLKEYFFFREITPGVPVLQGSVNPLGKKVTLEWAAVPNATKYKIYYGLSSGQYAYNLEVTAVSGTNNKTIDNLVNGLNYYFAVTALTDKNSESFFSNEVKLKPQDITPPAIPSLQASAGDGKITLFWNSVPEAVSYIAYLGTMPKNDENEYAFSVIVRTIPPANTPNVIFTGVNGGPLNENTDYYVSVRSVDQYGNISNYAPEIIKRTNEPYLISLEKSENGSILAKWLPFYNAKGYNIYYADHPNPGPGDNKISVGSNVLSRNLGTNLNGRYYVNIKAIKQTTPQEIESSASNERSVDL